MKQGTVPATLLEHQQYPNIWGSVAAMATIFYDSGSMPPEARPQATDFTTVSGNKTFPTPS
jgi:hypothetical protein